MTSEGDELLDLIDRLREMPLAWAWCYDVADHIEALVARCERAEADADRYGLDDLMDLAEAAGERPVSDLVTRLRWQTTGNNAGRDAHAAADAIETGRQWETIARQLVEVLNLTIGAQLEADAPRWTAKRDEALAAFRATAAAELPDRSVTGTTKSKESK